MPTFSKGTFSINLPFVAIAGELTDDDRQCAWEFYSEIISRVAVRGKLDGESKQVINGEIWNESLDSLYSFFQESRAIMRKYPVGKIALDQQDHLGFTIAKLLELVIRPFLEKWQASYRYWWAHISNKDLPPFNRQDNFPKKEQLIDDWLLVRAFCRDCAEELANEYKLVPILTMIPEDMQTHWLNESLAIGEEILRS